MFFETEIGTPIVCVMIIFFYREIDRGTEVIILKNGVRVAVGIIRERGLTHGNPLMENEEKVEISQLTNGALEHPKYGYSLEESGYCAWDRAEIRKR